MTGGSSRRLGVDKATLQWQGATLAHRAAEELLAVCEAVVEVGDGVAGVQGVSCVRETPRGEGPLAALLAGVDSFELRRPRAVSELLRPLAASELLRPLEAVILLACDYPFVDRALLALIRDYPAATAMPIFAAQAQYVCAKYSLATIAEAREQYEAGQRGFRWLTDVALIAEREWLSVAPEFALRDIDTIEDARAMGITLGP